MIVILFLFLFHMSHVYTLRLWTWKKEKCER